ncbi:UNVERIFIED_CONTAM: hypothetical protein K2H54_004068 [Gekko kuhli]
MLGSRVCWQLLLGWALLLGQPVLGDSGSSSSEERSLREPGNPAPVSEGPENPAPVSEEPENPVPVSEEPENPVAEGPEKPLPELEEPEDLLPELDEPELDEPVQEELEEKKPLSDEELEELEKEEREWLMHEEKKPCGSWLEYLKAIALGHYNKNQRQYYKPDGHAFLRTKKAIGTTLSLKVVLMRTNCTKDQLPADMHHRRSPYSMYHYFHQFSKNCVPVKGSEMRSRAIKVMLILGLETQG